MVRPIIFTLTGTEFVLDGEFSREYENKRILIRGYKPMTLIHIKNINCKNIFFQRLENVVSLNLENITAKKKTRENKFHKYSMREI